MSRRAALTILVAVLALATIACELSGIFVENNIGATERGSGNVVEETRPVSGVTGIDLATFGTVIIQIGDTESLRIEAEDNLMKYFNTDVSDGTLRIRTTPPAVNLNPIKPVNFFLTVKELHEVNISGSGDIQVPDLETSQLRVDIGGSGDVSTGELNAERLEINIGGSGDVNTGRVKIQSLQVKINGSGDITLSELNADNLTLDVKGSGNLRIDDGQVRDQEIDINGSGNFQADNLTSEVVNIRIGGSGDVTIWVTDRLDARINGSGNVRYYGRPSVSSTGNGSGDITSLGDK